MPLVQIANCQLLQSVNVKSGTGMGLCKGVAERLQKTLIKYLFVCSHVGKPSKPIPSWQQPSFRGCKRQTFFLALFFPPYRALDILISFSTTTAESEDKKEICNAVVNSVLMQFHFDDTLTSLHLVNVKFLRWQKNGGKKGPLLPDYNITLKKASIIKSS